jgi:ABC-type transport system involved in multi-copper enzyme maturation permease subunit
MNGPHAIYAVRLLIRDTFRQAIATRICWIMLAVSAIFIVFCLGVRLDGGIDRRDSDDKELYYRNQPVHEQNPVVGEMRLLFGAFRVPLARSQEDGVHFLQVVLATLVAGSLGLLLILLWTSGFLPEFLQPSAVSVLLAKPIPRWTLLVGKYLGVVAFVAFQVSVFFTGTWLALGMGTGVWSYAYLLSIPILVIHFAVIYSFSVLLAVCTRSSIACVFGSILFWLVCLGMNYGRHAVVGLPELSRNTARMPSASVLLVEAGYWLLPKPADLVLMQQQALQAGDHFVTLAQRPEFKRVLDTGDFSPEWTLLTSLLFTCLMLACATRQLATTDY